MFWKKKKIPYSQSFAKRLTRRIVLTLFITLSITTWMIVSVTSNGVDQGAANLYKEIMLSIDENVKSTLSNVRVAAINNVHEIEQNLGNSQEMYNIVERIVKQNDKIHGCGISFRDGYYPKEGRWFQPLAVKSKSGKIISFNLGSAENDYLNMSWFEEAMTSDEGFWSKPFFESNDSVPLIAFLIPIHDASGATVAVLGADLSLEWLREHLKKMDLSTFKKLWENTTEKTKVTPDGKKELEATGTKLINDVYSFIITDDGTFVSHPDESRILNDNFFRYTQMTPDTLDDHVGHLMTMGLEGFFFADKDKNELEIEGEKCYLFYAPIEETQWSMGIVVPSLLVKLNGIIFAGFLLVLIIIAVIVIFTVCWFSIRRSTRPLVQLAASAGEVAKGHFDTPLPETKHNDEISLLRDSFMRMQTSLATYVEELKTTATQKAAMENELYIANSIQMAMLPTDFPERDEVSIYGMLTPAKAVGGDLFDVLLRDNRLYFCIGDVSGKGVPASLVMAVIRSLFHNISYHSDFPAVIMSGLNEAMTERNDTNMFVTIFVGVLDLDNGQLTYCNAGHDSPLLIGRQVRTLPCDSNIPIGVMPQVSFSQQQITIEPETTIFLFTDGLDEAEDSQHNQFGSERIYEVASRQVAEGHHQPKILIEAMTQTVHRFVGDAVQSDDLTMLAVEYRK